MATAPNPIETVGPRVGLGGRGAEVVVQWRPQAAPRGSSLRARVDLACGALFVVDTLEYLHSGGRSHSASRWLVGSCAVGIGPVRSIWSEGKIEPLVSITHQEQGYPAHARRRSGETKESMQGPRMAFTPAPARRRLYRRARTVDNLKELFVSELTLVIGANVGPGVVGMGYYTECRALLLLSNALQVHNITGGQADRGFIRRASVRTLIAQIQKCR